MQADDVVCSSLGLNELNHGMITNNGSDKHDYLCKYWILANNLFDTSQSFLDNFTAFSPA
jgi:hypothetical protein